jgi:hypothetical protein
MQEPSLRPVAHPLDRLLLNIALEAPQQTFERFGAFDVDFGLV